MCMNAHTCVCGWRVVREATCGPFSQSASHACKKGSVRAKWIQFLPSSLWPEREQRDKAYIARVRESFTAATCALLASLVSLCPRVYGFRVYGV